MIQLTEIGHFMGPSLYGRVPMMCATIALSSPDVRFVSALPENVVRALESLIPGLSPQLSSPDAADAECPIWAGEWLDTARLTLAVALQILWESGAEPEHGDVVEDARGTHIVYSYENLPVCAGGMQLAVNLVNVFIMQAIDAATIDQQLTQARNTLDDFYQQARKVNWTLDMRTITREARARGIPFQILMHYTVMLGQGKNRRIMMAKSTDATSHFAFLVSSDKSMTIELLRQHGLPVPTQRVATSRDEALAAARDIGYPVVLKPTSGGKGSGVTPDVRNDAELVSAFERAKKHADSVIVETLLQGTAHRFTVIDKNIVGAAAMYPPVVVGDGEKTIAQLVEQENRNPLRDANETQIYRPIGLGGEALNTLENVGLTPESVPPAGERVLLSNRSNTSRGGTFEFIDDIHPDVAEAVLLAHQVIGLDISGVDFILPDASKTWRGTGGGICEVNATPGIWGAQNAADGLFEYLFPPGTSPGIPVAAILGAETGSRVSQLLSEVLRAAGHTVGLACTDGCFVNDSVITPEDASDAEHALQVQRDPRVDALVLQTGPEKVVAQGFGFDPCDVAAVTDAVSETGDVEKLFMELTRGTLVLDADNPRLAELLSPETTPPISLVTLDATGKTFGEHIESGGDGAGLERDGADRWIVTWENGKPKRLFRVEDLPSPPDDSEVRVMLFALAMAVGLGIGTDGLKTAVTNRRSRAAQA